MSLPITITLTTALGALGPFDLYSDADGFDNPFDTGIPISSLTSGYGVNAPDDSFIIRVQSTDGCNIFKDFPIQNLPTPTVTPTNTPTNTPTLTPTPTVTPTIVTTQTPTPTLTSTPTATPKAPYFGIIRTSAPSGPSDCSIGGISIGGSQGVWEFQSTTNSIGAGAVFTDYPGTTYNTLSQFNLQIGTTYYLCDLSYGWTSFIYYGDNTVRCNTVNGCPVSYEFAVYTGTSEQVCHFFNEATGYTYGAHQYFVQNGFLIITTVNDNNVLNDGFNPYYSVGSNPPAVIDGDNSTFWIGEDGNYGTFDSEGNFSLFGSCGGNIV